MEGNPKKLKCVLLGDGAVGKTSLLISYLMNGFPQDYAPTAFDNYCVNLKVDDVPYVVQFCDTAGQEDFDSLRPLCYPHTDVFILCFSVVSPSSFANVAEKWLPEIRKHHRTNAPVILVGTQSDLRSNVQVLIELSRRRQRPITEHQAQHLVKKTGAICYLETSAITEKNLKEVFDEAVMCAIRPPTINSSQTPGVKCACNIM